MTYNLLRKVLLLMVAIVSISGCANFSNMFGEDAHRTAAQTEENQTETARVEQGLSTKELSPEALEAQQARDNLLALINAPNRFILSKAGDSQVVSSALARALSAYRNQDMPQALRYIEQAKAEPTPLSSGAYVLAGDIYLGLANSSTEKDQAMRYAASAKQSFANALSLNTHNYKAANRLGLLHRERGEFKQALKWYTQAIEAYPGHAVSYRNRGILLDLYMADKAAALADYRTYITLLEFQQAYHEQSELAQGVPISPEQAGQFAKPDELKRELRRAKGWQIDLERQLKAAGITLGSVENKGLIQSAQSAKLAASIITGSVNTTEGVLNEY